MLTNNFKNRIDYVLSLFHSFYSMCFCVFAWIKKWSHKKNLIHQCGYSHCTYCMPNNSQTYTHIRKKEYFAFFYRLFDNFGNFNVGVVKCCWDLFFLICCCLLSSWLSTQYWHIGGFNSSVCLSFTLIFGILFGQINCRNAEWFL